MYDMRYVRGELMQENADSVSYCWIRDAPARQLDFPALSSICDTFFPRLFLRRPRLVPVATVSLNIYFHVDHALIQAQKCDPVLAVARGQIISGGYFDQEGQVWGAGDRLLATTQQIVWFRD